MCRKRGHDYQEQIFHLSENNKIFPVVFLSSLFGFITTTQFKQHFEGIVPVALCKYILKYLARLQIDFHSIFARHLHFNIASCLLSVTSYLARKHGGM
jgi:hypothetical protein